MKKIIVLFFIAVFCNPVLAQTAKFKRYYIQFTDKNNNPYSISNPSAYLSERAIQRRLKQNIPIDELDIPITPAYIESVASTGAVILNPTKWLNGVTIVTSDTNVLLKIEKFPFVQKSSPVSVVNVAKITAKKNSVYVRKTAGGTARAVSDSFNYGGALNQIQMINGIGLHKAGFLGQGMVIASLDDGYFNANILSCYDSLFMNHRLLGTRDFVNKDNNDLYMLDSHGCETLSDMAAYAPGEIVGTAPKASYWLLRTENDSSENPIEMYNWASAAEFADSVGADIITSSLGYSTFDDPSLNLTYADMNGKIAPCSIAAGIAASKGIIVCNSAGNDGNSAWHYITAPGDADSILTVGAVDPNGNYASFSGHGPSSDGRIKPNVAAQGAPAAVINPSTGGIAFNGGTSFSCPTIAGMTACLWQEYPNKTNRQIIQAIEQSASIYSDPDDMIGYGIPNYGLASILLSISSNNSSINQSDIPYLYPNPFSDELNLIYYNDISDNENVQIYDMLGRLSFYKTITSSNRGYHFYTLTNLNLLSKGVYILTISSPTEQHMIKIVKM